VKRPAITKAMRLRVFELHGAIVCCQGTDCDSALYITEAEIDHHLALIDGGAHDVLNMRPLCRSCHSRKSASEHKRNSKSKRVRTKGRYGPKGSGHASTDKPKRRLKGASSLRGRSNAWPESQRKLQPRQFPKRPEQTP